MKYRISINCQRGPREHGWAFGGLLGVALAASLFLGMSAKRRPRRQRRPWPYKSARRRTRPSSAKSLPDAILYPLDQAAIVPKIAAPVKKFYVERGSQVHAGRVLAELESAGPAGDRDGQPRRSTRRRRPAMTAAVQKAQQDLQLTKRSWIRRRGSTTTARRSTSKGAASAKDVDDASVSLPQAQDAISGWRRNSSI